MVYVTKYCISYFFNNKYYKIFAVKIISPILKKYQEVWLQNLFKMF